jgi:hypothetical protein
MKIVVALVAFFVSVVGSTTTDALSAQALSNLEAQFATNMETNATCTLESAAMRREWAIFLSSSTHNGSPYAEVSCQYHSEAITSMLCFV